MGMKTLNNGYLTVLHYMTLLFQKVLIVMIKQLLITIQLLVNLTDLNVNMKIKTNATNHGNIHIVDNQNQNKTVYLVFVILILNIIGMTVLNIEKLSMVKLHKKTIVMMKVYIWYTILTDVKLRYG